MAISRDRNDLGKNGGHIRTQQTKLSLDTPKKAILKKPPPGGDRTWT